MSPRKKKWLIGSVLAFVGIAIALVVAGYFVSRRFEPYIREQAVHYLEDRFQSEVELKRLSVKVPEFAPVRMLWGDGPILVTIIGEGFQLRHHGRTDVPPMFILPKFTATIDLRKLFDEVKMVPFVELHGMELNLPRKPKGDEENAEKDAEKEAKTDAKKDGTAATNNAEGQEAKPGEKSGGTNVVVERVLIHDAKLAILPRDPSKQPLRFDLHEIDLTSAGKDVAMNYKALLTNAKPPGEINSTGTFGPWAADDPHQTPLAGSYIFDKADLGVFNGIAGILHSTGTFEGQLGSIVAKGEATVPDFRLKMSGNPVPLATTFEVLVDGTNGNTELRPVNARLGSTNFRTSGGILRHQGDPRKTIELDVLMPNGNLSDLLTLAMKGDPFMKGTFKLNTKIKIPPLSGKVKEKLELDGHFEIDNGIFLKSKIQDQIDSLSRRGQGQPKNEEIDEEISRMSGDFRMRNEVITFENLAFAVTGAAVHLGGGYHMEREELDFRGALLLDAKVSETQSGWKRWLLKPVDPFFSKNGVGTFLKIKIEGSSKHPKFGLDR